MFCMPSSHATEPTGILMPESVTTPALRLRIATWIGAWTLFVGHDNAAAAVPLGRKATESGENPVKVTVPVTETVPLAILRTVILLVLGFETSAICPFGLIAIWFAPRAPTCKGGPALVKTPADEILRTSTIEDVATLKERTFTRIWSPGVIATPSARTLKVLTTARELTLMEATI